MDTRHAPILHHPTLPIDRLYWGSTALFSALMLLSGSGDLLRVEPLADDLRRLGYPDYLMTLLGVVKLLGAPVLLHPRAKRLKEWAYAGFTFDLGGATFSQLASGAALAQILAPASCATLLAVSYVAHRIRERRSPPSEPP